mmetsp:Transcript_3766/g.9767  ORF Transcript_3766/g.9767 Transcript_3766/m.9767 type:complete len:256 (+) Transcript_3766:343-1110(+)
MELNFEERVTELEVLLQQRQEDFSQLSRERKKVEAELQCVLGGKSAAQHKLYAVSCEKADLQLTISRGKALLCEEKERLHSAMRRKNLEAGLAFRTHCLSSKALKLLHEEGERAEGAKSLFNSILLPMQAEAIRKQKDLQKLEQDVSAAARGLREESNIKANTKRLLAEKKREVQIMTADFDAKKQAIRAAKSRVRESSERHGEQNKRLRADLKSLQLECESLKRTAGEMNERSRQIELYRRSLQKQLENSTSHT